MPVSPRILYVDDDVDGSELIEYWLRGLGYDVVLASDGESAGKFIGQEYFDLYLLDYCLPDVTATSLCRDIKDANPTAPIIVYSALDRDVDRAKAIKAGANAYFVKPDQMDQVGSEIQRIFRSRRHSQASFPPVEIGSTPDRRAGRPHSRKKASGIL